MKKLAKMNLFATTLVGLALIGCTRAKEDLKVTFSIPNLKSGMKATGTNGAMAVPATAQLGHLIINVTGAGIPAPVLFTWDSCHGYCPSNYTAPSSFSMTVPSGTARLVQVLAVYTDPANYNMYFYYGDTTADLTTANVALDVPITQVSTAKPVVQGQVTGRYITSGTGTITNSLSDEVGPTGVIDISYDPGGGKQALLVEHSTIISGWFSFFMLSGVNLKYTVRSTGEVLWGGPVGLDSSFFNKASSASAGSEILKAYIPAHRRANGTSLSVEGAEINVWGYWGPAVSSANMKYVCSSGMSGTLSSLFQASVANSTSAPTALTITTGATPPTNEQLLNLAATGSGTPTSPYGSVFVEGGESLTSSCGGQTLGAPNEYLKYQVVASSALNGNGKEMAAGISGMLGLKKGNGTVGNNGQIGYVIPTNDTATPNLGNLVLNVQPLPGLESVMNEVQVFKKISSFSDMNSNSINCLDIINQGFSQANISANPLSANSATPLALATNITPAEAASGVDVVICPVSNGSILPYGTYINRWSLGFQSGNQGPLATNLKITTPQDYSAIGDNAGAHTDNVIDGACTPLFITTASSTGMDAWSMNSPNITLISNAAPPLTVNFYQTNDCISPASTFNVFGNYTVLYMKASGTPASPTPFVITASTTVGSMPQLTTAKAYFASYAPTSAATLAAGNGLQIKTRVTQNLKAFSCERIGFELWDPLINAITIPSFYSASYVFTAPAGGVLNYYNSMNCSSVPISPAPSISLSGLISTYYGNIAFANTGGNIYATNPVPPTGSPTIIPIKNTDPANPSTLTPDVVYLYIPSITAPGIASTVEVSSPQSMQSASCQEITVTVKDLNWYNTSLGVAQNISLNLAVSSGTASYFTDLATCTAGTPSSSFPASLAFGAWDFTKSVYVKNLPVGPATISTSGLSYSYTPIGGTLTNVNISPAIRNVNFY